MVAAQHEELVLFFGSLFGQLKITNEAEVIGRPDFRMTRDWVGPDQLDFNRFQSALTENAIEADLFFLAAVLQAHQVDRSVFGEAWIVGMQKAPGVEIVRGEVRVFDPIRSKIEVTHQNHS